VPIGRLERRQGKFRGVLGVLIRGPQPESGTGVVQRVQRPSRRQRRRVRVHHERPVDAHHVGVGSQRGHRVVEVARLAYLATFVCPPNSAAYCGRDWICGTDV